MSAGDGKQFAAFLNSLDPGLKLPSGVTLINPYREEAVRKVVDTFCSKFYRSSGPRVLIFGINPGRLGGGITGISFTDPVALQNDCGIANPFDKKRELSSRFVYEMIAAYGGAKIFYNDFLLSAVCPLGLEKDGKNYNYYDEPKVEKRLEKFIADSLRSHFSMNVSHKVIVSLGKKNTAFLEKLNSGLKLFSQIITLEHPRYIMQYKLKTKNDYIRKYLDQLSVARQLAET